MCKDTCSVSAECTWKLYMYTCTYRSDMFVIYLPAPFIKSSHAVVRGQPHVFTSNAEVSFCSHSSACRLLEGYTVHVHAFSPDWPRHLFGPFRWGVWNGWSLCTITTSMVSWRMRWDLARRFRPLHSSPTWWRARPTMDPSLSLFLYRESSTLPPSDLSLSLSLPPSLPPSFPPSLPLPSLLPSSLHSNLIFRTISNWVLEFDRWAPTVVKVTWKVSSSSSLSHNCHCHSLLLSLLLLLLLLLSLFLFLLLLLFPCLLLSNHRVLLSFVECLLLRFVGLGSMSSSPLTSMSWKTRDSSPRLGNVEHSLY